MNAYYYYATLFLSKIGHPNLYLYLLNLDIAPANCIYFHKIIYYVSYFIFRYSSKTIKICTFSICTHQRCHSIKNIKFQFINRLLMWLDLQYNIPHQSKYDVILSLSLQNLEW